MVEVVCVLLSVEELEPDAEVTDISAMLTLIVDVDELLG